MPEIDPAIVARFVEQPPQPTVAVRLTRPMADLDIRALFDEHIPRILAAIGEAGGTTAGPPFARYHAFGPDRADIEFGFPVAAPPAGIPPLAPGREATVGTSELPGGRLAVAVHRGPYETLGAMYDRLHDWIHAQGPDEGAGPWESYVDDPSAAPDMADLRTEIWWPVP
jgi:hypothetical protein